MDGTAAALRRVFVAILVSFVVRNDREFPKDGLWCPMQGATTVSSDAGKFMVAASFDSFGLFLVIGRMT